MAGWKRDDFLPRPLLFVSHVFFQTGPDYLHEVGNLEVSLLCSQVMGSHLFPWFHSLKFLFLSFASAFLRRAGGWVVKQRRHQFFFPKTRSLTPTFLSRGRGWPLQPCCPITTTKMLWCCFLSSADTGCQRDPTAERERSFSWIPLQHHTHVKLQRSPMGSAAFHFP